MGKRIVISFPGGRGSEIPILYFSAKYFEDIGYEKVFINHSALNEVTVDTVFFNARNMLESINWSEYEHIVFVAKSLGTVVACKLKELLHIPASLVLYTPIEDTMKYINPNNDILLVAMGDEDRNLSSDLLLKHCKEKEIKCYIEHGVGHRMEVMNDLSRNLEIVYNVLQNLELV